MPGMSQPHASNPPEKLPVIEREELIKKLEKIPTEVLRSILANQVDLEIRLKHKELALTDEEIGKCEAQMLALRKFLEVPNEVSFRNEPSNFTLKYYTILNEQLSVNFTRLQQQQYQQPVLKENIFEDHANGRDSGAHSYRTRSTTSSLRPYLAGSPSAITGCLYRRTDGVVVKLTCSDCHRSNFSSAQGFLNHNRIAHSKEFTSQDAAALSCGEALADELQDEEGLMSVSLLRQRGLDASKNLSNSPSPYDDKLGIRAERTDSSSARRELGGERKDPVNGKKSSIYEKKACVHEKKGPHERINPKIRKREDEVGSKELMKKLIDKGIAQDASEYQAMVSELRTEVPNSHLFEGESEVDDEEKIKVAKQDPLILEGSAEGDTTQGSASLAASTHTSLSRSAEDESESEPGQRHGDVKYRSDTGGKYENRLRRRKSRSGKDVENDRKRRR